jgi:hypothetical protein
MPQLQEVAPGRLAASQNEAPPTANDPPAVPEEALIADTRAGLTPAEFVERKLIGLLKSNPLPISHSQVLMTGLARGR